MKYGGKNANSMKWKRQLKMNNNPQHGGKRQGAGRKPIPNGDNMPIYCGMLDEELRADILALPVQARKLALESMVKYAKARTDVEHVDIVRHVCFDWQDAFE